MAGTTPIPSIPPARRALAAPAGWWTKPETPSPLQAPSRPPPLELELELVRGRHPHPCSHRRRLVVRWSPAGRQVPWFSNPTILLKNKGSLFQDAPLAPWSGSRPPRLPLLRLALLLTPVPGGRLLPAFLARPPLPGHPPHRLHLPPHRRSRVLPLPPSPQLLPPRRAPSRLRWAHLLLPSPLSR